jgi:hypothetical protein
MWLFDDLPIRWVGLDAKRPAGMALEKATDVVILIFTLIVLYRILGIDLGSVYL